MVIKLLQQSTFRRYAAIVLAPCQNVNVLLSNITFIIFAVFDV